MSFQDYQKKIFLSSEGDQYFSRNVDKTDPLSSQRLSFFEKHLKPDSRILEIGCSSGENLLYFTKVKNCEGFGIDPSRNAIECGRKKYPFLNLSVGTADKLDFDDESFDFVLFGFCLYLVDRKLISRVVAEADRVLKDNGFLGIVDFDSKIPKIRKYRHCEGVMSYKMSYHELFLALPHYFLAEKISYSHSSEKFVQDVSERVCSALLFKDHSNAYFPEKD